ncbi:hypothetical protein [Lactococcus allomyrinae]|uniref:Uncharacterized protein n=1 Tax=Lactococcus allomyrinae TaxID=2419773 RepID=A0A387B7S3_9LACT|nr:hypothetical protein [Lactococcus allomyrinae]AYF99844.1 hypothetical protein D7I46_01345 [Lactococcus allomyrinae]
MSKTIKAVGLKMNVNRIKGLPDGIKNAYLKRVATNGELIFVGNTNDAAKWEENNENIKKLERFAKEHELEFAWFELEEHSASKITKQSNGLTLETTATALSEKEAEKMLEQVSGIEITGSPVK